MPPMNSQRKSLKLYLGFQLTAEMLGKDSIIANITMEPEMVKYLVYNNDTEIVRDSFTQPRYWDHMRKHADIDVRAFRDFPKEVSEFRLGKGRLYIVYSIRENGKGVFNLISQIQPGSGFRNPLLDTVKK